MSRDRSLHARVVRRGAAIALLGIVATTTAFGVVRGNVDRLTRRRIDRPATQALLGVQNLMASVDQILATANGAVAASGVDPARFDQVLGAGVRAASTVSGIALVRPGPRGARVVARVGDTPLLDRPALALVPTPSSTLVAFRHDARSSQLGFAARAVRDGAAVFLEISLPTDTPGTPFALVTRGDPVRVVVANVASVRGLTTWNQTVSFGGRTLVLRVAAGGVPAGALGLALPTLVLLAGIALTLVAMTAGIALARRADTVRHLGVENLELDRALERQQRVEAELRASQERFRTILRDSPDMIALFDLAGGTCEILNRADFLGHPLVVVEQPGGITALVDPDDRDRADALWSTMREVGAEHVSETTLRLRDSRGGTRFVRLRLSPLGLADPGEQRYVLGLLSDVTEQWTREQREAELREALRRSQRLEAVGQLAGGVAHDFNNLLAAIMASAELLSDDVPEGRPREYAEEIQRSAMRGAALVRQLLTFGQRDRAEPRVINLNDVVEGMEPLLRRSLGENVQLQITTTDCSTQVLADPTHVEQVVLNLVVNARDAMPDGGILWVATAIDFDDEAPQNDRVLLSVTDTGRGIAPEVRDRMFEPFVTTKPDGQGTGLGLFTVQSIVNAMNGTISVQSREGEGTTFEISLARCYELRPDHVEPDAPAPELDGAHRRVLLVEDESPVRAALGHSLERRNFDVTPVANAADALRAFEQHSFDVVVTDAILPGMSGPELIDELVALQPDLPVVLMSGYSRELFEAARASVSVQLRKPFSTSELLIAIEHACAPARPGTGASTGSSTRN